MVITFWECQLSTANATRAAAATVADRVGANVTYAVD
jgi:hypothetical protein